MKKIIVGFKDEASLVRRTAQALGCGYALAEESRYHAGEVKIKAPTNAASCTVVTMKVGEYPCSFFRLLLLAAALHENGAKKVTLVAPWIAYGRQDRATKPGEAPAGIVVANSLAQVFDRIVTLDAHSPEFIKGFKGKLINRMIEPDEIRHLVSPPIDAVAAPDKGALKRAKRVADRLHVRCLSIDKSRKGKSVSSRFAGGKPNLTGAHILLIDDMADSGSTLLAAAKLLKKAGARRVTAFVTHAFYPQTLYKKLKPAVDDLVFAFDHKKNRLIASVLPTLLSGLK